MLPLYQALKISMPYPYATMRPVPSITLPMLSMWRWVMKSPSLKTARSGTARVMTMAKPA
jgi:hypothetical protein